MSAAAVEDSKFVSVDSADKNFEWKPLVWWSFQREPEASASSCQGWTWISLRRMIRRPGALPIRFSLHVAQP